MSLQDLLPPTASGVTSPGRTATPHPRDTQRICSKTPNRPAEHAPYAPTEQEGSAVGARDHDKTMAKTTTGTNGPAKPAGLTFPRTFTKDIPPGGVFTAVEWETRTAAIENTSGESVFKQEDIEVPKDWSQQATNIVADKYFRGNPGTDEREHSVR